MADPRRNSNTRNADANAAEPRVRVTPANDAMFKFLAHPRVPQPFAKNEDGVIQSKEWPLDSFTRRRIRDGDVNIEGGAEAIQDLMTEHAEATDARRMAVRSGASPSEGSGTPNNDESTQGAERAAADQPHTGNAPNVTHTPGQGAAGTNRAQRSETARQNTLRDAKPDSA
jgi:hypothetical protein